MNRYLLAMISCASLAGCIRHNGDDAQAVVPRADTAPVAATEPHAAEEPAAAPTPTGSRILPPPEALTDPVITAKIKASLLTDPLLRGSDVSVNTTQGVVNLTGVVASQEQAAIASAHAQREDGVMRVDDHLSVNLR